MFGIPCVFPYVKYDDTFNKCETFEYGLDVGEYPICPLWAPGSLNENGEHRWHADCEDGCEKQGI